MSFTGKTAVITGAASGIGKALSTRLAKEGVNLALCDRDENGLSQTKEAVLKEGINAIATPLDVVQPQSLDSFADKVKSKFGKVDLLVNSAGVTIAAKPFTETTHEEWKWIMDVNLWGTINTIRSFLPIMNLAHSSSIVNMSSMLGLSGMTNQTAYVTTKFAIRGFTESLRMELADKGIHVIAVHPGAVKTNFIDNSWADEDNKALIKSYIEKMGAVSADQAATKIIRGIEKGKSRILIGKDAFKLDLLTRLLPGRYTTIIMNQIKKNLQ